MIHLMIFGIASDFVELQLYQSYKKSQVCTINQSHSIGIFALWPAAQLLHFHLIQLSYLLAPRPRM